MDLDQPCEVEDFSPATLTSLARRIEASTSEAHLIYRESELDEMWRLLDMAIEAGARSGADVPALIALREAVVGAHDLVGISLDAAAAARVLRAAAAA